jgi:UDP-glucose 4-epimerase
VSRVLVTGGAGFIGSHVVDRLVAAGHEPRILDIRPSEHHPDVDIVLGDIRDLDVVRRAAKGCDAIAHLAAAAEVNEVALDPVGAEHLNCRGTLNVLQAARDAGVDRVVYASTIWVYSDVDAAEVDEDTALSPPAHLYTATKLAGELYCKSYGELYGVQTTVLRFGIPYGPRARPTAVVPIFVRQALAGEPLTIAGDGSQSRRFVYVEDLAEGVVCGLAPQAANRTYNLVGDEDTSVRDIAETVRATAGDVEIVHVDGRSGDFRGAVVSGSRAAEELGWRATTSFALGVSRYVAWVRGQETAVAHVVATERPARLPQLGVRQVRIGAVGLVAGLLAAAMTRADLLSDPASLLGTLVLLGVPTALVARLDWNRERRDALIVIGAMLTGTALVLARHWTGDLVHLAHAHARITAMVLAVAAVGVTSARRRLARA